MKRAIIWLMAAITFNRIRGRISLYDNSPSLRWWWTPWTYRFGHGGWIFLSPTWFRRFWRGIP